MGAINKNLQIQVESSVKWSAITEIAAKIVTPITAMVLARILAPEAFGVVVTVTMIVSFAEMFTDAGFQKYLVQHEFKDDDEKHKNTDVAFWTNLGISFFLWAIIAIFCEPIATLVGNKGLGNVITIACIQLPLSSFSSIQMALYRRDFDFKTLFLIRVITIFIPFFVTIPLALYGFSYWALIIGLLCGQLSNAIILTIKSKWKPKWFYSVEILKEMLGFSAWSLMVSISIWFTMWVDALIIGSSLNEYYLGLYKTSTSMVNTLMTLITASILPVLFPALSRLQDDYKQFKHMYFTTQRLVSIFVFPMGVGVFLYSDLATQLLLGSQWSEASDIIGIWSLTSAITIVFGHFCSEAYRARGKPALSFLSQVLHLVVLVPVCIISSKYGFWALVYARSWIRMQSVLVDFIIMKFAMGFSVFKTLGNVFPTAISAATMGLIGFYWRQQYSEVVWSLASIILCTAIYFGLLYLFPNIRKEMIGIVKRQFHMKHSG